MLDLFDVQSVDLQQQFGHAVIPAIEMDARSTEELRQQRGIAQAVAEEYFRALILKYSWNIPPNAPTDALLVSGTTQELQKQIK